jgi:hypothetical protein
VLKIQRDKPDLAGFNQLKTTAQHSPLQSAMPVPVPCAGAGAMGPPFKAGLRKVPSRSAWGNTRFFTSNSKF